MHGILSVWLAIPAHHPPIAGRDGSVALAGLWVAVAGLAVGLGAPLITWWLRKSRKAKFHVPHLGRIMEDLDTAIGNGDLPLIRFHLIRWRMLAANAYGILMDAKPDDVAVPRCLLKSIRLAQSAGAALVSDDERAVSAYMAARNAIADAFDTLNIWVSRRHR